MFMPNWMKTAPAEMYHTHSNEKPGLAESHSTGTAMSSIRVADVMRDGSVLPIAWNMLELTDRKSVV